MLFQSMRSEFGIEHVVIARKRGNDPIEVLFAKNAHDPTMAGELCSRYTSHYYLRDPVLTALGPAQRRELLFCSLALSDIGDAAYRSRFFLEPNFAGKVSIISRTPDQLLYLNFYRRREDGAFRGDDLWKLQACGRSIAAIAERHFALAECGSCSLDMLIDLGLPWAARLNELPAT
jgi:hypothetical protein